MSQIKKGSIISYCTVVFNIFSGIFFTPYLINRVGTSNYGVYILVVNFLNYFFIDFGLGNSVSKFISNYRIKKQFDEINNFLSVIFKLFFVISLLVFLLLWIIFPFLNDFFIGLTSQELELFKKMYVINVFSSTILFIFIPLDGLLTAYELFVPLKGIELFRKVFIIALSVIALSFSSSVVLIVIVNFFAAFLIVVLKLYVIKKNLSFKINWYYFDWNMAKEIGSFAFFTTIILIAQRLIIPIGSTVLGRFSNSFEISVFSIATTIEGYIATISNCMNNMFLPRLTLFNIENKTEEINNLFVTVGRLQTFILGGVLSAFLVFGQEFLNIWVGEKLINSYYVILLITLPGFIIYAQDIANTMLVIKDKLFYKAICYSIGAIISLILSFLLSPTLGAIGVGIGISVCMIICHIICMNFIYKKILKLDIKHFFYICYQKSILILVGLIIVSNFFNNFFITHNFFELAVKILIYVILYIMLSWTFYFNNNEKKLVKNFVIKFKQNS